MLMLSFFKSLFLFSSGIYLCGASCRSFAPAEKTNTSSIPLAPVFIVPECDHRNGIEKVYFKLTRRDSVTVEEITVVFRDEDQPFFLFDGIYDVYRRAKYHRKKRHGDFFYAYQYPDLQSQLCLF